MPGFLDLPNEILHYILSQLVPPQAPGFQSFWSRGINPQTLLPPNIDSKERKELGLEQAQVAKRLCLVSRRLKDAFMPIIWSRFDCGSEKNLQNLGYACTEGSRAGSYIQHMSLRLQITDKSLPTQLLPNRFEVIWPRLTSLRSLTLVFTSASSCPAWLAAQLQSVSTLQTLRLCIFGNSLGPHLRAPSQLQNLHIEIHPPDLDGRISHWAAPNEPIEVSREAYHDWTDLFNDVSNMINENRSGYNLKGITWFIHWTMVHSFYKHMKQRSSEPSGANYIDTSSLNSLSRLSLTLESQMGTRSFMDAAGGLPLTDLALTAYDLSLLNGTVFRVFCSTFPELRRLRVNLRTPSITVGDGIGSMAEGFANEDEFIKGLTSLRHLEAYKGPVLFQRQKSVEAHHSLSSQVKISLARLLRSLRATGMTRPRALFQWHVWLDGVHGPKQYMMLPEGGPEELE